MKGIKCLTALAVLAILDGPGPGYAQSGDKGLQRFREIYKELVETNTTVSAGDCTLAAKRVAARLKTVGYPDQDLRIFVPEGHPAPLLRIVGGTSGIRVSRKLRVPPPRTLRIEGSSVTEAARPVAVICDKPACPRIPRNAPVPPVIAIVLAAVGDSPDGEPGGGGPKPIRVAMIVPTGVPSTCWISHTQSVKKLRVVSEIACSGCGVGV